MTVPWIAAGLGLAACLAHLAYVNVGISKLLNAAILRRRLGKSSVELLYVGGTLVFAGLAGVIVFGVLGLPPAVIGTDCGWLVLVGIAVTICLVVAVPASRSREPSRLRRFLLCLGGGAEEVLWRGVSIAALLQWGLGAPWGYLAAAVGFSGLHFARYGRRGIAFILLFSLAISVLAWAFGLLAAVAAHIAWNAYAGLRRRREPQTRITGEVSRTPVDEW